MKDARFIFIRIMDDIVTDGTPLDYPSLTECVRFLSRLGVKTEVAVKMKPLGVLEERGLADRDVGVVLPERDAFGALLV